MRIHRPINTRRRTHAHAPLETTMTNMAAVRGEHNTRAHTRDSPPIAVDSLLLLFLLCVLNKNYCCPTTETSSNIIIRILGERINGNFIRTPEHHNTYYGYHSSNHYYYAVHCCSDWLITILLYRVLLRVPMRYAAMQETRTTVGLSSRPISLGPRNFYFFRTRNDTRFDRLDFTTRLTQLLNTVNRTKPVNVKLICVMCIVGLSSSCQRTPWMR